MDITEYNRQAWDGYVERGSEWTIGVGPEEIERARNGEWQIILTPLKPVPRSWFPTELHEKKVLGLASGGGQQGPILAAAGASVTILDNSPRQLERDRQVAQREGLTIATVQGLMEDLSMFEDASFDLIVHPVSNLFTPNVRNVWKEASRVLKRGRAILSGFLNPAQFLFDLNAMDRGEFIVKNKLPYNDLTHLSTEALEKHLNDKQAIEFGHTLEDLIGGQIEAGLMITGFYEDGWTKEANALSQYMDIFIATRAVKI